MSITEADISIDVRDRLNGLGQRCVWHDEVWLISWTHSLRPQADRLRIDFVAELDNRLIGIEVKAPPESPADLGRYLLQCAQYATGKVAANRADVPQTWIGKALEGVFLSTTSVGCDETVINHFRAAHRLYGPANVGFLTWERRGLYLRLCGERFWTEWSGYHQGMLNKTSRVGNGKFRAI